MLEAIYFNDLRGATRIRAVLYGYIRVKGIIANPFRREQRLEVEFIADTSAIYTMIPKHIAERLGLQITDKRRFRIASGEIVEYPVSEAYIAVEGRGAEARENT